MVNSQKDFCSNAYLEKSDIFVVSSMDEHVGNSKFESAIRAGRAGFRNLGDFSLLFHMVRS